MLQEITNIFHRPKKPAVKILQHAKRSNDAIIILRQDNLQMTLKIEALNLLAIRMLGYENEEIVEHDLGLILPNNINAAIEENLEFGEQNNSIDSVLNKVANFKIKTKDNTELPVKLKIIRSLSSNNIARFQIVLNDSSLMESLAANRLNYRANIDGKDIFDKKTALLTKQSIIKDMELIANYSQRSLIESCYVIYKLNPAMENSENEFRDIIKTIETTKRANDIVGILENNSIIVLLPETLKDNIKIAINRIYGKLSPEAKSDLKIHYSVIDSHKKIEDQLIQTLDGKAETF